MDHESRATKDVAVRAVRPVPSCSEVLERIDERYLFDVQMKFFSSYSLEG